MKMWTWPWVTLSKSRSLVFLNRNPYFLLFILVAYLESFPKYYNKVTFHWVLSELWSLKVIVPSMLSMCVWAGFLRARACAIYPLLDIRSRARNWVHSFRIEWFNFFLFFVYIFSFNFFTLLGFFKAFFIKLAAYSSNEIVDIILVLGEVDEIIVEQKDCIVIDIHLDDIQM